MGLVDGAVRRHSRIPSFLTLAAIGSVALVVVVNAWMASAATIPVLWTDEVGYLANAQVLSGVGEPRDLAGRSYYLGWSVLITPLWWLTSDLELLYRLAVGMSAVVGIALVWPLTLIARKLGLSWQWSVIAASIVAVAPSHAVMSTFALAENLVTFLLAFTVLAALHFRAQPTIKSGVLLGLSAASVFIVHGRMVPVLIAVGLYLLIELRRNVKAAVAGLLALAVPSAVAFVVYRIVVSFMYAPENDREASAIERIFGSSLGGSATAAVGQLWYEAVVWGGLTVFGIILVVRGAVAELRRKDPGVAFFSLLALGGALVVSSTWLARVIDAGRERIDVYAYGRYLEPYGAVFALVGLVLVLRALTTRTWVIAIGVTAALSAVFALVVAPQINLDGIRFWGPTSVPGLLPWQWPHVTAATGPPWLAAGIAAGVAIVLMLVLRRWPVIVAGLLLIAFAGGSIVAKEKTLDPYFATFRSSFTLRADLAELRDATVAFDKTGTEGDTVSRNAYQYWGATRPVIVFKSGVDEVPDVDLVIARKEWELADELGARKLADDTGTFDNAIWVLPGDLFTELEEAGRLG